MPPFMSSGPKVAATLVSSSPKAAVAACVMTGAASMTGIVAVTGEALAATLTRRRDVAASETAHVGTMVSDLPFIQNEQCKLTQHV